MVSVPPAGLRKIIESFLVCAFEGVGKAPRHLDGGDLHSILGHLLPSMFAKRDPLAAHVLPVLRSYLQFLEERAILPQSYELRTALEKDMPVFARVVETGEAHVHHGHSHGAPQKPIVNKAEKTGRNDPCICGSGRKFKQCCMKM